VVEAGGRFHDEIVYRRGKFSAILLCINVTKSFVLCVLVGCRGLQYLGVLSAESTM
jgi:hypothetical protein